MTQNNNEVKLPNGRRGIVYNIFKEYVRFCNNVLYYRRTHYLDREKIPDGVPLMIVSDHQNGLNDALNLLFAIRNRNHRKMRFIARADVFKPAVKKALAWLGIYPAYRLSFDGAESLSNNYESFGIAANELVGGGTVAIYPEAGHQDKHWLGKFSLGFLRIAFDAVEKTGFEKEIYILPSCNHYSDYFHMRKEVVIRFGEVLALSPYYEEYKKNPRAAQQSVSDELHRRIKELMLSIDDVENYEPIDYLRNTYGIGFALQNGNDPKFLPEKLLSDKRFFERLEEAKVRDGAKMQKIYDDTARLSSTVRELRIEDRYFDKKPCCAGVFFQALGLLLSLPLFLLSAIPNVGVYYAPRIMTSKIKDRMLHSGFDLAMTILVAAPVIYLLTFGLAWIISGSFLWSFAWLLAMPALFFFFWNYRKWFTHLLGKARFRRLNRRGTLDETRTLRENIYRALDESMD